MVTTDVVLVWSSIFVKYFKSICVDQLYMYR